MPQEYIAFQVWTDSQGRNHVLSTGLQDHPVDPPAIPDWAMQESSPEWISARGQTVEDAVPANEQAAQPVAKTRHTSRKKAHRAHHRKAHKRHAKHGKHRRALHRKSRRARR